ncbi:MAG: LysR substrate-binding domain-containing protein [Rhodovulum sp.]
MNLSVRQLTTFREVMRAGSISQAARALGRTQPAVSAMVAALERELGFALFLRAQGKLTPTPEARFFLEETEDILGRLDQAKQTLSGISKLEAGHLRIACLPAASGMFLPGALTGFLAGRPDVRVSLVMRTSRVVEDLIASQQFDLGFAEAPARRASIRQSAFDIDCVCVLPADDALAARAEITPADLDGADLAMLYSEHPISVATRAAFGAAGCGFRPRFELQTFLPGLPLVAAGLCYMICDPVTAHGHLAQVAGLAMRPFHPRVATRLAILEPAHRPQSRLAAAFRDHLATEVAAMRDGLAARLAR